MSKSGSLVVIGGAEDKENNCSILKKFLHLAGGTGAHIAVLAVASEEALRVEQIYNQVFKRIGAAECVAVHITERNDANNLTILKQIEQADGIFFTGGDQLRITSMLGGTKLYSALHEAYAKGKIIAGTSAGASVISEIMIVDGDSERPPTREIVNLSPGLGLLEGIVIDQHFAQRGRLGRLLSVVAYNPQILGVGIDENTAVIVDALQGSMDVVGEGAVTIVDGQHLKFTNVASVSADQTLAVAGYCLHTHPNGYKFDLRTRQASLSDKEEQR